MSGWINAQIIADAPHKTVLQAYLDPLQWAELRDRQDFGAQSVVKILEFDRHETFKHLTLLYFQELLLCSLTEDKQLQAYIEFCSQLFLTLGDATLHTAMEEMGQALTTNSLSRLWCLLAKLPKVSPVAAIYRVIFGETTLNDVLSKCGLSVWDRPIVNLFPLCGSLDGSCNDTKLLIEPLCSFIQTPKAVTLKVVSPNQHSAPIPLDVRRLAERYLDTRKTTHLRIPPPTSNLCFHQDSLLDQEQVWSRKTLGKVIAQAILVAGNEAAPSMSFVDFTELSLTIRVKDAPLNPSAAPSTLASGTVACYLSGILAATSKYARIDPINVPKFLETVIPETWDYRWAGFIAGLGVMGKLRELSPVEILGLISCGHPVSEASAVLGIAASKLGSRDQSLIKIINLIVKLQSGQTVEERYDISPHVRMAAPLALGLCSAGSADPTSSALLFWLLRKSHQQKGSNLNHDALTIHAGLGLALINCRGDCGLTFYDVESLLTLSLQTEETLIQSPRVRCAALIALSCILRNKRYSCYHRALPNRPPALRKGRLDEIILIRLLSNNFAGRERTFAEFKRVLSAISAQESPDLDLCVLAAGDCLYLGLEYPFHGPDVVPPLDLVISVLAKVREQASKAALTYSARYRRLVYSTAYDLILLGSCLWQSGRGDARLLRLLSKGFPEPADYNFSSSYLSSLALAFLTLDHQKEGLLRRLLTTPGSNAFRTILLASLIPLPGIQVGEDPVALCRHTLVLSFLQGMEGNFDNLTVPNPWESLREWKEQQGTSLRMFLKHSSLGHQSNFEDLIALTRLLC